jgi:hypothetical protein
MARCVVDEIFSTTASRSVATTPETRLLAGSLHIPFSLLPYWTDEDWVGDPLRMRSGSCASMSSQARPAARAGQVRRCGTRLETCERVGARKALLHGRQPRQDGASRHDPVLSAAVIAVARRLVWLVAVRRCVTWCLSSSAATPHKPARWPLATLILLRHCWGTSVFPVSNNLCSRPT